MSGNVWEWCLNEYNNPRNVDPAGDACRVVRGGAWGQQPDERAPPTAQQRARLLQLLHRFSVGVFVPIRDTGH